MAKQVKSETARVPQDQFDLPVGFTSDGSMVTLREVTASAGNFSALSLAQLTPEQVVELTTTRIEMQPKFEIGSIGAGVIGKERAISEIKAGTRLGKSLEEIEMRVIRDVQSMALKQEGKA